MEKRRPNLWKLFYVQASAQEAVKLNLRAATFFILGTIVGAVSVFIETPRVSWPLVAIATACLGIAYFSYGKVQEMKEQINNALDITSEK